ncbi:wd repeat-containing protein [Lasius niger]|uniref:Wd repeat-containing protein n=1 Tax=Lasius niger TaxID=67767 RepID=A0A0J7L9R5_LASNI|nr:wd repeat-containing protein [Lasius niger]
MSIYHFFVLKYLIIFHFNSIKEDRKSEEKQKDANISRDIELQNGNSWLQRTRQGNSAVKNRCQITHELRFTEKLQGLYSARFSKSGEIIAAGFGSGAIQMRNGGTGELIATLKSGLEISMPVMCCRFNPVQKEIFYASSACGSIFMCNTYTKEFSRFIFELKNEVNTIDISTTGDYLVSGGKDATVRLYDARNTKLILQYKRNEDLIESKATNFHRMRIFASRFHHEYPNLIITGGWDDTVRIWDIRVPTGSIRVIKGPHICGDAIDIRETRILTGSWVVRDSLQIWDLMSAKLIETINPQNRSSTLNGEFLYAVQYLDGDPYGDLILTGGSGTGALEVISLKEKKV